MKKELGQFFTPEEYVLKCISLSKYRSTVLEPSCGDGAFLPFLENEYKLLTAIEIDKDVIKSKNVLNMNFFNYSSNNKFDTIIGNPPYVDNSLISQETKELIKGMNSPKSANLFCFFIEKSLEMLSQNGEIIFIVPRGFIKATSCFYINTKMYSEGTITHFYDFGDTKIFKDASPNICIFRYEKNNFSHKTKTFYGEKNLAISNGVLSFIDGNEKLPLKNYFDVCVGAVSGADSIFEDESGLEFVCSKTNKSGILKKLIYNNPFSKKLLDNKETLLERKICKFDETNWFMFGRNINFKEGKERIYVNMKTRNKNPFFISSCDRWDGSILALFPKSKMNLEKTTNILNEIDWKSFGFETGGRFLFGQKSLSEALIDRRLFE